MPSSIKPSGANKPRRILVIDAIEAGHEPGELFELDPRRMPAIKLQEFSLHQAPSSNILRDLQTRGIEVRILACQTPPLTGEVTESLSPRIADAVGRAAEWVVSEYLPRFTADQIAITMTLFDPSDEIEPGLEVIAVRHEE